MKKTITFKQLQRLITESTSSTLSTVDGRDCEVYVFGGTPVDVSRYSSSLNGCAGKIKIGGEKCLFNGHIDATGKGLTSLDGSPAKVYHYFNCSNNNLTSLKGGPVEIRGDFICDNNPLESLKYAPGKVDGEVSLKGTVSDEEIQAYMDFLKMSPSEKRENGLLSSDGYYIPRDSERDDSDAIRHRPNSHKSTFTICYPDYEDADYEKVEDMKHIIEQVGGKVLKAYSSEDDGEAIIRASLPPEVDYESLITTVEEEGWEIA